MEGDMQETGLTKRTVNVETGKEGLWCHGLHLLLQEVFRLVDFCG